MLQVCLLQLATPDVAVLVDFCAWFDSEEPADLRATARRFGTGVSDASVLHKSERVAALDRFLTATLLGGDVLKVRSVIYRHVGG